MLIITVLPIKAAAPTPIALPLKAIKAFMNIRHGVISDNAATNPITIRRDEGTMKELTYIPAPFAHNTILIRGKVSNHP